MRRVLFTLLGSMVLLGCTTFLVAQLNRGAIEGNVADPQGLAMSGVEITITSVATNVVTSTKTNDAGYYRAEGLVPGTYRAHFVAKGYPAGHRSHRRASCRSDQG
jgi:formylmethanofuran dehydrogenase subunit C